MQPVLLIGQQLFSGVCVFRKLLFVAQHITLWLHCLELRGFPLSYFTCSGYVCRMAFDTTLLVAFLTLILPTRRIGWANNVSRWQMGFKSVFKGLSMLHYHTRLFFALINIQCAVHVWNRLLMAFQNFCIQIWNSCFTLIMMTLTVTVL